MFAIAAGAIGFALGWFLAALLSTGARADAWNDGYLAGQHDGFTSIMAGESRVEQW